MTTLRGCILLILLWTAAVGAYGQPASQMSREDRIAVHRQKIQDILDANRMVSNNTGKTTGTMPAPRVSAPTNFDSTMVPLFKKAGASDEQVRTLREINQQLWDLRSDAEANSPGGSPKVKSLLERQGTVLSEEQGKEYSRLHREHMAALKAAPSVPAPQPPPAAR